MVVVKYTKGLYSCLSTDTKPTSGVDLYAVAVESDTGKTFFTVNNGGTWTQISLSVAQIIGTLGVAAGGTGATTLTGILKGSGTSAITAVTAPSGAILGDTDTQTETNKTMNANANTFRNLGQSSIIRKCGDFYGRGSLGTNSDGILTGLNAVINVGTGTQSQIGDTTGINTLHTTGTTVNSLSGQKWSAFCNRGTNVTTDLKFTLTQTTNTRCFLGLHQNAGSNPASSADPMNTYSGCALWYDSAVSANWKIYYNSAGGSNLTDTGVAADTSNHTLSINAVDATPKFTLELTGGTPISVTNVTGDIPSQTVLLGYYAYIENTLAATASTISLYGLHTEQDK